MPKKIKRPAKPRDPFWRLLRALRQRRVASRKAYRRAETRRAERAARTGGEDTE